MLCAFLLHSFRKLLAVRIHPGDGSDPGRERQQPRAGWRLLLEVPVYAPLGGPGPHAGLPGQRRAAAWGATELLPAQRRHRPKELEANAH